MTSNETPLQDQIMSPPDPRARIQRRRAEFWQISWLVALSSLLISVYALFLSVKLAPTASQHDLDTAALMLADELGRLTVKHSRFGTVGLIDVADGPRSTMGLNRLQATLRLDGIIADQLDNNYLGDLVRRDAREAERLAHELARQERELADPKAGPHLLGRESLKEIVRKVLAQTGAGSRLKALKITLGGLGQSRFGSRMPLPAIAHEQTEPFADRDSYRVHVDVPISRDSSYQFFELADAPSLVTSIKDFSTIQENAVASVVLIEADFEVVERGHNRRIQKMQSCAIVGAPKIHTPSSVFMLSFPQGYYSAIASFNDLFAAGKYTEAKGEWYQAEGGEVPGEGQLSAAAPEIASMPPDKAALHLLYHFMFNLGPSLIPENLKALLSTPLASMQASTPDERTPAQNFNSGLFKDTGTARFALQRQSGGEEAKKLLSVAFSTQPLESFMPPFTFPLVVDSNGSLHLPQENSFDEQLVKSFLDSLYKTNIAGLETMHIGSTIVHRMDNAAAQSTKTIASLREELRSVIQAIEALVGKQNETQVEKKLKEQVAALEKSIKDEEEAQANSLRIKDIAARVEQNGKEAARSTYEIGSHMFSFAEKGLKTVTAPFRGFLLSRSVVFIPHETPIDDDVIFEAARKGMSETAGENDWLEWTSQQFRVTEMPDSRMFVDNRPIIDYWQTTPHQVSNKPIYILMSSTELLSSAKKPTLFVSRQTPFDNGSIARSQLCYLATECMQTAAKESAATWSVLARDLVYSRKDGAGQPLISLKPRWCLDLGMNEDSCPGLAVEMQIRTPIPKQNKSMPGAYLQDPNGGPPIALYPPLPVELM